MSHSTLRERSEFVHGWSEKPPHLDGCDECRRSMTALQDELDLLRRAEARVRPVRHVWRLLPLGIAAAALVSVMALVFLQPSVRRSIPTPAQEPPKPVDPILAFLEGSDQESARAREELRKRGPEVLPLLVAVRLKNKEAKRLEALSDLIFDLKNSEAFKDAGYGKLETMKMDFDFAAAKAEDMYAFIREFAGFSMAFDPVVVKDLDSMTFEFIAKDVTLRAALDLIDLKCGLDYDFRYGVLFFSKPERLWSMKRPDPPTPLNEAQSETALPLENQWTRQELEKESRDVADKLRSMKVHLDMNQQLSTIVGYLREMSGSNFAIEGDLGERAVTAHASDVSLKQLLELLTLPLGQDVRIEKGVVVIYEPKKK